MMGEYGQAIETRLKWLRWLETEGRQNWHGHVPSHVYPMYLNVLRHSDTYFMDRRFAELVDHARRDMPDTLAFDATWLLSRAGFCLVAMPFDVPRLDPDSMPEDTDRNEILNMQITVAAVAWHPVRPGDLIMMPDGKSHPAGPGFTQFMCFTDRGPDAPGFSPWSYFALRDGQELKSRLVEFEVTTNMAPYTARYLPTTTVTECVNKGDLLNHPLHEVRWVYAALYLMAQRLSIAVEHRTDRAVRRRCEREKQIAPEFVRLVTLRRMHEARKRAGAENVVDWQWQWEVSGHWRDQFYPSLGIHKPVYIDMYMKGPDDKPIKPPTAKLFVAKR